MSDRRAALIGVFVGLALAASPTVADRHPIGPVAVLAHVR